jgi:hypothetical protein
MTVHLYLSMLPEALIASMLTPEEFGVYYAVGSQKKSRGQAIFFEIDPAFRTKEIPIDEGIKRCVAHPDGTPKRSIYLSVYRALENVSLDAILKLYLVTPDGRTLGLQKALNVPKDANGLHLYQEIAPVHPLVVSSYGPSSFYDLIVRNPTSLLSVPAVCFAELRLGDLATDPENGEVGDLPYSNMDHLRQCLSDLKGKTVHSKMVDRIHPGTFQYRTIQSGIFIGNRKMFLFFPMPSREELRQNNYAWWRSANM